MYKHVTTSFKLIDSAISVTVNLLHHTVHVNNKVTMFKSIYAID